MTKAYARVRPVATPSAAPGPVPGGFLAEALQTVVRAVHFEKNDLAQGERGRGGGAALAGGAELTADGFGWLYRPRVAPGPEQLFGP